MSTSKKSSNARLAIYSAPVAIGTLFLLGDSGGLNLPGIEIISSIKSALGKDGFTVASESLKLLGSLGGGLLTTEGHERFKSFLEKLHPEELYTNKKLEEAIKKTIIFILKQEKDNPKYENHKKNIERVINALDKYYNAITNVEPEEINKDIFNRIFDTFKYKAEDLSKESSPLTANEWKNLLEDVAIITDTNNYQEGIGFSLKIPTDFESSLDRIAETLEKQFPKTFQNYLEKDFAENKETYAKFVLDFLKKINNSSDEIKEILSTYKEDIKEIKQNTSLGLQQGQINHAELRAYLDKISAQIENLQNYSSANNNVVSSEEISRLNEEIRQGFQTHENQLILIVSELRNLPSKVVDELERREKINRKSNPKGFVNSPREPNDFFVEQSNIFARLDEHLGNHHIGYLHGTHGLGKTTTVCEYGSGRANDYEFVFYVLATDNAIINEMAQLADRYVETVGAEDTPEQKALKLKNYLEENSLWEKKSKNWLIIFDNLESKEPIEKYFPKTNKGDVLYTCNEKLYVGNDREVNFEQFSQTEAELFVFQKLNSDSEKQHEDISAESLAEIKKLVARLGKLPLALNVATTYLVETKISIGDYVGLLNFNVGKFLKYKDTHQASQHGTAFEAFLITLDKVKHFKGEDANGEAVGKFAEIFLNLLIFCAPEDIPEELIKDTLFQTIDTSATETPPDILFRETVALLKGYGLVKEKEKPFKYKEKFAEPKTLADGTKAHWEEKEIIINVFETYRTLQDVLSVKLETEAKKSLLEQMLVVFSGLLPKPELTTWEIFGKYAVHTFPIAEQAEKLAISNYESFMVCNQFGFYFQEIAKYREAEYFYLRGKTIAEDFYSTEHKNTATSYSNLASLYRTQGRYAEAEPLYKKVIDIFEKALGENHPDTATSYNNLASLYDSQGKYAEAEPLYKQASAIREKVLGENHPDTAGSYLNLGAFYYQRGQSQDGLELCEKALKIYQKTLPAGHPHIQLCESWVEYIKNSMS